MAIEQFGKITYNDINNLNNESITTKNIYASGTSADIGTSDNPFNTVYANTYYGGKFIRTPILDTTSITAGNMYLQQSYRSFEYLEIYCYFSNEFFSSAFLNQEVFHYASYGLYQSEHFLTLACAEKSSYNISFRLGYDSPYDSIRVYRVYGVKRLTIIGVI